MKTFTCPACKSDRIISLGRRYPVYPSGCVVVLGFPFAFLHQGQIATRYRCDACGDSFSRRNWLERFNLALLVFFILCILTPIGWLIFSILSQG